jgi:hypothetical protein
MLFLPCGVQKRQNPPRESGSLSPFVDKLLFAGDAVTGNAFGLVIVATNGDRGADVALHGVLLREGGS